MPNKYLELGMKANRSGEILTNKEIVKSLKKACCCLDLDEG